ncbi:MAG: response regulator [Pseudomonadota bacterium]
MNSPQTTGMKRILIIDDEPSVVMYLETLLQDNGYATATAGNGREGFEEAKRERPDLVCLDITMPEESGIRFYRNLKGDPELKSVPVVVVTAVTGYGGDSEPFEKFLSTRKQVPPPEAFFSKPIDRQEFLDAVGRLLSA